MDAACSSPAMKTKLREPKSTSCRPGTPSKTVPIRTWRPTRAAATLWFAPIIRKNSPDCFFPIAETLMSVVNDFQMKNALFNWEYSRASRVREGSTVGKDLCRPISRPIRKPGLQVHSSNSQLYPFYQI